MFIYDLSIFLTRTAFVDTKAILIGEVFLFRIVKIRYQLVCFPVVKLSVLGIKMPVFFGAIDIYNGVIEGNASVFVDVGVFPSQVYVLNAFYVHGNYPPKYVTIKTATNLQNLQPLHSSKKSAACPLLL